VATTSSFDATTRTRLGTSRVKEVAGLGMQETVRPVGGVNFDYFARVLQYVIAVIMLSAVLVYLKPEINMVTCKIKLEITRRTTSVSESVFCFIFKFSGFLKYNHFFTSSKLYEKL
jgi:hypothetical protein